MSIPLLNLRSSFTKSFCANNPISHTLQAFFKLLRAGLWEKEVQLECYGEIDFAEIQRLAVEQSVVGLVTAGFEHVTDLSVPKRTFLQLIGQSMQQEQQNTAMNKFIGVLFEKLRDEGIECLLIKGQGVAQCYERPLRRANGDVDLLFDDKNYEKAKAFLTSLASSVEPERKEDQHLGMTINSWVVELHGTLHGGLSKRVDNVLDSIKKDTFDRGSERFWNNGATKIPLLSVENDAIYIFTHILEHFYKGGIGLRQICDWCRLLWTYRDSIEISLLETRLNQMGLTNIWKGFGAFAVKYLGMPSVAMPLYSADSKWEHKADRICSFIIEVGNFGQNRDMSYYGKYPFLIRKAISFGIRCRDLFRHSLIFPGESLRFAPSLFFNGLILAARGLL